MQRLQVECVDGLHTEKIYEIRELSLLRHNLECSESQKRGIKYLEIPCAFDIETTNIYKKDENGNVDPALPPYSFMYHWQFCINDEVCFGRTWEEFTELLDNLTRRMDLDYKRRLVIWCHQLRFEFTHFKRFVKVVDGFYKEGNMPLKVVIEGGIEFRDSYTLSNMNLKKFCENERGVIHYKLSGDNYDYYKIRTATTPLSDYERAYCYNDVRGLVECIRSRMQDDTLATMPMTSTGYVRRDARIAVKKNKNNRKIFTESALTPNLYTMCRDAFRGGNTHANIRMADQLLTSVSSYDIQSSYPACMMCNLYPVAPFFRLLPSTFFNRDLSEYALLIQIRFTNLKYKGKCGIPYIPLSKCMMITRDRILDNGRVLYAGVAELVITDLDLDIIRREYIFDDIYVKDLYASHYGRLSPEYKSVIMQYFEAKTRLKGDKEHIYEYNRAKNKLNALYGMMAQRIDHEMVKYDGHDFIVENIPLKDQIEKYYKSRNSFLSYQHGVWVTCHARARLQTMLEVVGKDVAYCDTDSIKCINDHQKDFDNINKRLRKEAEAAGAFAADRDGNIQYMGTWEYEGIYDEFKTLGAKSYIYKKGDDIISTISGVNKSAGAAFFSKYGIEAFTKGTRIKDSGHLTAFYNDDEIHVIDIDGCKMTTASNVAIVDNTYTIGVSDDYLDLLEKALANQEDIYYI